MNKGFMLGPGAPPMAPLIALCDAGERHEAQLREESGRDLGHRALPHGRLAA